jgi:CBS domain-containing protein
MNTTGTIEQVLHHKGRNVWSISPRITVLEAITVLAEKNVGAVLVMDGDKLAGMFSERDYTRKIILKGRSSRDTKVGEVVSSPVMTVSPDHTVEECMRLMTEHRVRHLPVIEGGRVVGVVSIGDLVNWTINAQTVAIEQMKNYISGGYPV